MTLFLGQVLGKNPNSADLSREKNYLATWYYKGNKSIVWGDKNTVIAPSKLAELWNKKPRKVPVELMLAKAESESGFRPFIYRYEVWADPTGTKEVDYTSGGLFQMLGLALTAVGQKSDMKYFLDIDKQLDAFDAFMGKCIDVAKKNKKPNESHQDIIYRAIMCYGMPAKQGSGFHPLADGNYQKYLKIKADSANAILKRDSVKKATEALNKKYLNEKQQKEEQKRQQNRKIKRIAVGAGIVGLVGTGIFIIIKRRKKNERTNRNKSRN